MNIIDMYLLMDSDLGVDPEILLFREVNNFITIRLSKRFKGERHYQQFEIAHPAINKKYAEELEEKKKPIVIVVMKVIVIIK